MALTYRLYLTAPQFVEARHSWQSALANYIVNDGSGADFTNMVLDPVPVRAFYCLARCDDSVHPTIAADPDIRALSPEFATLGAGDTWLNAAIGAELTVATQTAIESTGIPVDDFLPVANTRRQLFKRIAQYHGVGNWMRRFKDSNALLFLLRNLNETIATVPAPIRNRVSAWMTERGLETAWITGATLVRAVLKYILINVSDVPAARFKDLVF